MRSLDLDFVHRRATGGPLGTLLLAAGLLAAGAVALQVQDTQEEIEEQASRQALLERRLRVREPRAQTVTAPSVSEARAMVEANRIIARLNTPWQRLLSQAGAAAGPNIALTALNPDTQGRLLRISGVAETLPEVYAFVGRMQAAPGFTRVHLAQHESGGDPAQGTQVAFVVIAAWGEAP